MSSRLLARKTIRELRASRAQTLALVAVIALGVAVFIATIGAYRNLATSEAATYDRLRLADAWFELERTDDSIADEIGADASVEAVEGRLVVDTGLQVDDDRVRARLIGTDITEPASVNDVAVIDGHRPARPGDVMLERTFAERRNIRPGDTITVLLSGQPTRLRVAATVASPEYLQVTPDRYELLPAPSSFAVIFVDRRQLQDLTDNPGRINDLVVRFDNQASARNAIDRLEASLRTRGGLIEVVPRVDQASYAALEQDLATFRAIAVAIPTIILFAGIAATAVMLGRVVRAQRPLIGVMKALGYQDRAVLAHYLTYAAAIGVVGTAVGVVAGTFLGRAVTSAYTGEVGVPYTTARFHPALVALAAAISLAAVTLAAWRPARRSSRLPPALATRVDLAGTADRPGRRSRLERVLRLPLAPRLSLRTATRARARFLGTAATVATAIVLLLMVLALRDAVDTFLTRTFDLERWDISVSLDEPTDPANLDAITAMPGVTEASPFLETPARLEAGTRREDVLLTALAADQDLRRLRLGGRDTTAALAPGQIVLTNGVANNLHVGPNDTLKVTTPAGPATLTVAATSDEPIPARAYISLDTVEQLTGSSLANGVHVRVDGDTATIRSRLYDQPGVSAVAIRDEQRGDLRSLLSVFNTLIAVMLAFAVAMAFAVLFNAMTINVLEREREYATMRAVGARPRLIGQLLAGEATLLWAAALIPGVLVGTWVAARLGDAIAADLFVLEVRPSMASYLIAALGVLAIALVSLALPLRRIRRLDLAAATKTLG